MEPSLEGLPLKLPSRGRLRPPHPLQTRQRTLRREPGSAPNNAQTQPSLSGGVGELGPHNTGVRGEVPRIAAQPPTIQSIPPYLTHQGKS